MQRGDPLASEANTAGNLCTGARAVAVAHPRSGGDVGLAITSPSALADQVFTRGNRDS
jgi:hypothetical protein